MSAAYLAVKKLTGQAVVLIAARHNLREIQAELGANSHINPAKSHLNLRFAGPSTAQDVYAQAGHLMTAADLNKLRKDAVRAIEVVVSLPVGVRIEPEPFFSEALLWVQGFFAVPVLSAVAHLDEGAPHLHVLLLPLLRGRMVGSDLVGNKTRLKTMQDDFYRAVSSRFGLSRPKSEEYLSRKVREQVASEIVKYVQLHPECLSLPDVRTSLEGIIATGPAHLVKVLGLPIPQAKPQRKRSLVEVMTKPCKLEPKPKRKHNPIGFVSSRSVFAESEPYHCVGFTKSSALDGVADNEGAAV